MPLSGRGLKPAKGQCPNPLLEPAHVKQPLLSAELKDVPSPTLPKVYEYDIATRAGQVIEVTGGLRD